MRKVFVSYASADRARVEPFTKGLIDAGFDVWWDVSLRVGDEWIKGIERELKRADCIVIFWSPASVNTPWVRIEAHHARQKKCIVPVKLEAADIPDEYRLIQTLSAEDDSVEVLIEKLVSSIEATINRRQLRKRLSYFGIAMLVSTIAIAAYLLTPTNDRALLSQTNSATQLPTIESVWTELNMASTLAELSDVERQVNLLLDNESASGSVHSVACRLNLRRYKLNRRDSDLAQAQSHCAKARQMQPDNALLDEGEGWLALATGNAERAIQHFQKAIARNDRAGSAYLGMSAGLEATGQLAAAEEALSKAAVSQPAFWRTHNQLGLFLQRQGRNREALTRFKLALELDPDNITIMNNLGVSWLFQANYAEAIRVWNQVLDNTPERDRGATLTNIGSAYYFLRDFNAAKVASQKASRLIGDDYRAWANLADAQNALGEEAESTNNYRRALDRAKIVMSSNPQDFHATVSAMTFRSALGETAWMPELEQLLQDWPDDAELFRLAALAYIRSGNTELATQTLQRALALGYPAFLLAADYELDGIVTE